MRTDIDANRTLVTDQAGERRISKSNALGQLANVWEVKEPDSDTEAISFTIDATTTLSLNGLITTYGYDTLNNLTTVNQGVQTRTFTYGSLSRLLTASNPESGTISYGYDSNGNLTSKVDARNITTSYIYDALNRVTNRAYTNEPSGSETPDVQYFYDNLANAKGKLIKVQSSISTTEYISFDILGRVTGHKQRTDGTDYTTGYVYNLSGALIEETYPSGRVVKNTLDADGSLLQVQSKRTSADFYRPYAGGFVYNSAGAVTSMRLGNGKFETTQFNSRLQPIQIGLGSSASSQNLLKLNYTYNTAGNADNNGNVLSQTITVPTVGANQGFTATQTYTYDSLNRLNDAKEMIGTTETWKQTFLYDRYGNRTFDTTLNRTTTIPTGCSTAVCNPTANPSDNKLKTSDGYVFDNAGNTTNDAESRTFIYDSENKQVEVKNSASQTIGQYFYDGDGKRIKKYVPPSGSNPGETTIFVYDAAGKLVAEYSTIVEPAATAKVSYLTNDHLGSPRITTDAVGQTISRRDFMPFGEEISRTNYGSDSVRQKFTGYERDTETDLDFAQARMYNFNHGRFSVVDPLMASGGPIRPQSWNRYTYSYNNPYKFTDPTGMIPADYYSEDGKFLGSDRNEADKNSYIVKGTKKDNKNTKLDPSIAIATLPSLEERAAIASTGSRSQNPSNYYKGKESPKNDPYGNFHEEAVVIGQDATGKTQIINTAPGAVYADGDTSATAPITVAANQNQQAALDTMIRDGKVDIIAHSHPEGGVFPPPKPGSIMMGGTAVSYGQPPSSVDTGGANGAKTFIVVSTEKNRAYFYGRNGLQAQFPLDKFRKVGK